MTILPISGHATLTARANLRQGSATRAAPVLRKLEAGTVLVVSGLANGEAVEGNAHWYQVEANAFVWAGACGPLTTSGGPGPGPSPAPPAPAPAGAGIVANVIDIYHGDRVSDFGAARAAGLLGVIHKATTGGTGTDDLYAARRKPATDAGLLWGAYHWGTAAPAKQQVDNFLAAAKPDDKTLVALDFERTNGNQMTLERAREYLQIIEAKLGRKAVIYSGETAKSMLGSTVDPFFGAHRLWLCQYGNHPVVQRSWAHYWLWQYTDGINGPSPRSIAGVPGNSSGQLDCDFYPGDATRLAAEWAS